MVLTPQLLQAIKLLQMPNAELAAFIEGELERNPLLERVEDAPGRGSARAKPGVPNRRRTRVEPGDWASDSLESDPGALAQNLGTEIDNAFDPDRAATPLERAPQDEGKGLSATSWTGVAGRGGGEDGAPDLEAYVAAPVTLGEHLTRQAMIALQAARRPHDRGRLDRRARRGRLSHRRPRGNRRAARRFACSRRRDPRAPADLGADRRLRAQPRRMSRVAIDRARPLRPGDARADRELAGAGQTRSCGAAPRLRRRRRGSGRHDRRDQAPRSQAGARVRRRGRAARDPRRLRHRRAGPFVARRAEQRGLAARAGQRNLCGADQARRFARGGSAVYLGEFADRELADQEPRAARAHHSQRRLRDRAPSGRLSRRRRRGLAAAQPEGRRGRDRGSRIRPFPAPPRTSSSRRRAACSR